MHGLRRRRELIAAATAALLLGCSSGGGGEVDCGDDGAFHADDVGRYCAYIVVRGGFDCPPELPVRVDLDDGTAVCTDDEGATAEDLPPEVCDHLASSVCGPEDARCVPETCKLAGRQCGCGPGEKCTVFDGAIMCLALAAGDPLQPAEVQCGSEDICRPGLLCAQFQNNSWSSMCLAYCLADDECPSGRCQLDYLDGATQDGAPAGFCVPSCNPLDGSGCPDGFDGPTQCEPWRNMWICSSSLDGPEKLEGDVCDDDSDTCAPGLRCVDFACRALCDPAGDGCRSDETCVVSDDPMVFEGVSYGECIRG